MNKFNQCINCLDLLYENAIEALSLTSNDSNSNTIQLNDLDESKTLIETYLDECSSIQSAFLLACELLSQSEKKNVSECGLHIKGEYQWSSEDWSKYLLKNSKKESN